MPDNNDATRDGNVKTEAPGALLAEKRKQLGMSEREAADALKISVSRLKSIESNDFRAFPSETYVKGHLKNYSRLLKCDEQEVMEYYNRTKSDNLPSDLIDPVNETLSSNPSSQKHWWSVYLVLVLLALLWGVSYWMLGGKDEPTSTLFPERAKPSDESHSVSESVNTSAIQIVGDSSSGVLGSSSTDVSVTEEPEFEERVEDGFSPAKPLTNISETVNPAEVGQASEEKNIVVSHLTAAEIVKNMQGEEEIEEEPVIDEIKEDTLRFDFTNSSWIQVEDATGTVLFKGLNKAGAELALSGTAPFKIVIGNVDGTSLVYNGEAVELDAPVGKKILRLVLGG